MGEIIDLDAYRRRRKRKGAESRGAGNRRPPERPAPPGNKTRPGVDPKDASRARGDGGAAVERNDQSGE